MATARLSFQPSLKGRALRLLSRREYSRSELERKLRTYEAEPGDLAQALDDLQSRGYLSDQRAADSLVHRRAGQLGVARIRQEMQEKGLARELIEQAVSGLQHSELTRAAQVWRRKFEAPPATPQERMKQTRFLLARGFAADVVRRVLAGGGAADESEL